MELPPILNDIKQDLLEYVVCPDRLPIHDYENNQNFWPRKPDIMQLLNYQTSPTLTTLKVQRDLDTGKTLEFREVHIRNAGATARNSMSLNRAPAPPGESTLGNASFVPFWPGSFPEPELPAVSKKNKTEELVDQLEFVPPGFKRGLDLSDGIKLESKCEPKVVDLLKLVQDERHKLDEMWVLDDHTTESDTSQSKLVDECKTEVLEDEAEVLPKEIPVLEISKTVNTTKLKGTEWAILLDTSVPVQDFEQKVPQMARQYEFELDTFQKLAIIQLEQHNHVFVAAHTSAGKTVVAEYAIALSQRHMTRTIYTSPIKALSNQKYRDFKRLFNDVGLITGDFQINQTASCLIMTTEILRSMLYCGSDITRDLEYVIFDEVHYINDRDRGHVWEQVLILLPAHVCVVMLSATVPNTVEFADWLGRTHQRPVYVITTQKRPVPLKHYLYTGTGGQSRNQRYLILDSTGWKKDGYFMAEQSIQKADPKSFPIEQRKYMQLTPKQEKTLWTALVAHLQKFELLPVVAFTFSRAKCDQNAENLTNIDLTSQKEKNRIHMFFQRCVSSLKEVDREIPQVKRMGDILVRGIGVHHSGVLPIIKEIVEMLFQDGLIKLLFATETFAMGVNMPTRTAIFDSISKHDGIERRNLKPAEYIQMAGRAGRRRLDTEGAVIILCKYKLPTEKELMAMMLGIPSVLQSQFKLTYGMVLSLLRAESLSVEGVMSRSFCEADNQKKMLEIKAELETVESELEKFDNKEVDEHLKPLMTFYERASRYLKEREEIWPSLFQLSKVSKMLTPNRILIVRDGHLMKAALLLQLVKSSTNKATSQYRILVLSHAPRNDSVPHNELWFEMMALKNIHIYSTWNSSSGNTHQVLTVGIKDIFHICAGSLTSAVECPKIDPEIVLRDWEKRQMERFALDPPGQTCTNAIEYVLKVSRHLAAESLFWFDGNLIADLKVSEHKLFQQLQDLERSKNRFIEQLSSTQFSNFEQQFDQIFQRMYLLDRKQSLNHLLSDASLLLYPDYQCRIALLRQWDYVDDQNRVRLKGRVACEMGMNELLITELVLRNTFTHLQANEVAALLSALVLPPRKFDKDITDPSVTDMLKAAMAEMERIHADIGRLEMELGIISDDFQHDLNFGLVKVVHEWASGMPFKDIMELTDIQEGIIVRCIQQLNDTICDVKNAARIIGDPALQMKMEEASTAIKRDIVFAASLYTV